MNDEKQYLCPMCGGSSVTKGSKRYNTYRTLRKVCKSCGHYWYVKDFYDWLTEPIDPTPAMARLITLWVGAAVAQSLGD